MLPTTVIGKKYEALALDYLRGQGYQILEKNYFTPVGEIDIICKDGDYTIFVEVKFRTSAKFGRPIEAITPTKIQHIKQSSLYYLKRHKLLDSNVRFDVVEILGEEIRYVKNAF